MVILCLVINPSMSDKRQFSFMVKNLPVDIFISGGSFVVALSVDLLSVL